MSAPEQQTPMPGCDYQGYEFGASYPDSVCIDGYLWDADKYENGQYVGEGEWPCPKCNRSAWRDWHRDAVIEDAMVTVDAGKWPFRKSKGGHLWGYVMQVRGVIEWAWDCILSRLRK